VSCVSHLGDIGPDCLALRPKRTGAAWQQLRASAAVAIEWLRVNLRQGWLGNGGRHQAPRQRASTNPRRAGQAQPTRRRHRRPKNPRRPPTPRLAPATQPTHHPASPTGSQQHGSRLSRSRARSPRRHLRAATYPNSARSHNERASRAQLWNTDQQSYMGQFQSRAGSGLAGSPR
jgi:hypothetical protein